jgi:GDP-fucose transporter C1
MVLGSVTSRPKMGCDDSFQEGYRVTNESPHLALARSAAAVVFYILISVGVTLLNRYLFVAKGEPSSAVFVSWFQFVVASVLIVIFSGCLSDTKYCGFFPVLNIKFSKIVTVIPLSLSYLLMIGINNLCLQEISISSYQVVRSIGVLWNILLRFIMFRETTSWRVCVVCFFVVIGFFIGTGGDFTISRKGLIYGIVSSFFAALYSVFVKTTIAHFDGDEFELLQYNSTLALFLLTPYVVFNQNVSSFYRCYSQRYWLVQIGGGIIGFILNLAIFWHIKYTSSLTHNLVGTLKSCGQTIFALFLFPEYERFTVLKTLGMLIVIAASVFYAIFKHLDAKLLERLRYGRKLPVLEEQEIEVLSEEFPLAEDISSENIVLDGEKDGSL